MASTAMEEGGGAAQPAVTARTAVEVDPAVISQLQAR